MHPAVDVGVARFVVAAHRFDDLRRLLGRGGVIEINERFPANCRLQDGKVAADVLHVVELRGPTLKNRGRGTRMNLGTSCCGGHFSSPDKSKDPPSQTEGGAPATAEMLKKRS